MKAYALTALSVAAVIGLVIATPMLSRAAGFGAATGVTKSLSPSVDLTACSGSIDPEHKIWLAAGCGGPGGTSGGGAGSSGTSTSGTSGTNTSGTSGTNGTGSSSGGGLGHVGHPSY
jgi:hypothetical protein